MKVHPFQDIGSRYQPAPPYTAEHAIAKHPLDDRSASKLLVACREGDGSDRFTTKFASLPQLLPRGTLLLRNVSKVVAARVPCFKATGGKAELFLLNPADSNAHRDPAVALGKAVQG